ncbi:CADM3 protein, partial [Grallaria varia]|nr:CADM3 protein [Grallaria varia]
IPQKPQIFGHEQPIDEEKMVRLTCRSSGSKPAAALRWRLGNRELKDMDVDVVEDSNGKTFTVISQVEFRVTKEENGAEVTCSVDHESLQNSERLTTVKLQVHCTSFLAHPSIPLLIQYPTTSLGWGGGGGASAPSHSSPQEFLWEKEGSDAPLQLSSDSVLIFPFLNKSDSGTYVCTATSSMGSVVAKYNLDVSDKPWSLPSSVTPLLSTKGPLAAASAPLQALSLLLSFLSPAWADASPVPSTSSTYHAMIGGVVAVIVFLLLSLLIVLGHYLIRHKGTYLTHEAKGSDDAPDADTAIINAEGGQAGGDDKKEYFI